MDWQERLEQARSEYQQRDYDLDALEGKRERDLAAYERDRTILIIRKHQLEGVLSTLVDLQQEESENRQENLRIAEEALRLAEDEQQNIAQQQQDVLEGMIAGKTPEQALAILNGVEQRLHEKNLTNADA